MLYDSGNAVTRAFFPVCRSGPGWVAVSYSINIATLRMNVKREKKKNYYFYTLKFAEL